MDFICSCPFIPSRTRESFHSSNIKIHKIEKFFTISNPMIFFNKMNTNSWKNSEFSNIRMAIDDVSSNLKEISDSICLFLDFYGVLKFPNVVITEIRSFILELFFIFFGFFAVNLQEIFAFLLVYFLQHRIASIKILLNLHQVTITNRFAHFTAFTSLT